MTISSNKIQPITTSYLKKLNFYNNLNVITYSFSKETTSNILNIYNLKDSNKIKSWYTKNSRIKDIINYFTYPFTKINIIKIIGYDLTTHNNLNYITLNIKISNKIIDENTHILDFIKKDLSDITGITKNILVISNIDVTETINKLNKIFNDISFNDEFLLNTQDDIIFIIDSNLILVKYDSQLINIKSLFYPQQKIEKLENSYGFIIELQYNLIYKNILIFKKLEKNIIPNKHNFYEQIYINDNIYFLNYPILYQTKLINDTTDSLENQLVLFDIKNSFIDYLLMFEPNYIWLDGKIENKMISNIYKYHLSNVEGDLLISLIDCISNLEYKYYIKYLVSFEYITNNLIGSIDKSEISFKQDARVIGLINTYTKIRLINKNDLNIHNFSSA